MWLIGLQAALLLLVCIAATKALSNYLHPGIDLVVGRGDRSLNWLYFTYVAATVACGLAIQVSEAMRGHKVFLLVLDYIALTYLFLLDTWFRGLVFRLFQIASQD